MECILQRTIQFTTSSKVTWLWSVTLQTFQSYRKRLNWPKAVWMERNHLSLTTHQQSFSNMKGKKQLRSLPCCVEKFGRAKSSPKNDCSCLSYPFQRKRTQPVSNQPIKQGKGDPKLPQYCCWWGVSGRASLLQRRKKHSSTNHQQSHHHKKKNIDDIIKFKTVFDTVWHKSLWCVISFKPLKCYKEAKGNLYSWTTTQKQTFARPASYHLCSTSFWRHHLIPLVGGPYATCTLQMTLIWWQAAIVRTSQTEVLCKCIHNGDQHRQEQSYGQCHQPQQKQRSTWSTA